MARVTVGQWPAVTPLALGPPDMGVPCVDLEPRASPEPVGPDGPLWGQERVSGQLRVREAHASSLTPRFVPSQGPRSPCVEAAAGSAGWWVSASSGPFGSFWGPGSHREQMTGPALFPARGCGLSGRARGAMGQRSSQGWAPAEP